jgi:Zn-dependent protease
MRLKLGRFARIDVFIHWTYCLAPVYIIYRLKWLQDVPWSVIGILMILLIAMSICVLLHEYGHALMARWFGVATRDIIITPIGGLARLERMPHNPFQELLISLAGPVVNLVIALLLAVYIFAIGSNWIPEANFDGLTQFPTIMMWINAALFLFNLIPAFPMDGGRILRSGLAFVIPHLHATLIAGAIGQACAIAFSIYGFVTAQYVLILIGVFVFFAARLEMNQTRMMARNASET